MTTNETDLIAPIYAFLDSIGISVIESTLDEPTFLPGIRIEQGKLVIDRAKLMYPGDILHEAGHIAVTLPSERPQLGGNITEGRPDKQGDELAVLLWTYAACQLIGLPDDVVFHAGGYKGDSNWLVDNFKNKTYIGLPLLVWMDMTKDNTTSEDGFPIMTNWLRPEKQIREE
ncbi:hypothetical protein GCM10027592_50230 [Spirosoma flavus]